MAKNTSKHDISTVCELLLKEWADQYPPEKVASLQAKAQSLTLTITETKEKLDKLVAAEKRLSCLAEPLGATIPTLNKALAAYVEFTKEYGDLGVSPSIPITDMQKTISEYVAALGEYMGEVHAAYFDNLDDVRHTIAGLTSLRDLMENLAQIPSIIRRDFFPASPDRRKPIIRDLCRRFKSLTESQIFSNCPSIPNPLIKEPMDKEEYNSLCQARKQAEKAADILKYHR